MVLAGACRHHGGRVGLLKEGCAALHPSNSPSPQLRLVLRLHWRMASRGCTVAAGAMTSLAAHLPCPQQLNSLLKFQQREPQRLVWTAAAADVGGGDSPMPLVFGGSGSVSIGAAGRRVASLFAHPPALCLERAVGEKHGIDQNLWDSCHFQAEVYPDLPLATTWRDLLRRTVQTAGHESEGGRVQAHPKVCPAERWTVHTVAAQLRSRDQLRSMMLSAAGVGPAGDPKPGVRPADALLFVSGSHPARHLPGAGRWLQDSFDLLLLASAMREEGYLPASLSLWAVENPMLAPVARLRQKADAGAEVVVTQPPLLWDRVQRWAEEADKQLVSRNVKVVLGLPIVPSIGNLDFWLRLCNVRALPEAQDLLKSFPQSEERDKEGHAAAVRKWNANMIQKSLSLPGVAGLHVMPLTKAARQLTLDFLADGTLPSAL